MKIISVISVFFSVCIAAHGDLPDEEVIVDFIQAAKERTLHEVRYDGSYICPMKVMYI